MDEHDSLGATLLNPEMPADLQRRTRVGVPISGPLSPFPAPSRALDLAVPSDAHVPTAQGSDDPVLPEVGASFVGFRLLEVLGRGAFGQVYLAEQDDLANRFVALKVAPDIFGESQTLAQLQHANIVPIYSVHRVGQLQAVCMPFFGRATLADIIDFIGEVPLLPSSGQVLVDAIASRKQPQQGPAAPYADGALAELARMTYVEAVLWLGERIADGLAHAHERGILHHDLKPANILLTDDGQPMLLDFNISEDTKRPGSPGGTPAGTLPYMSPEHIARATDVARPMDHRSDLFSVGIMLYELLAGRRPFKNHPCVTPTAIERMIADRHQPHPPLRTFNRAVSPAVASIVSRCLAPQPADRYQSARELQEDLRRQRRHLPLRHAPNISLYERIRKWDRRHPRLTSKTCLSVLVCVLLGMLSGGWLVRGQQLARLQANESLRQFRADAESVRFLLYGRHAEPFQVEQGIRRCRVALARFSILDRRDWSASPAVRQLTTADQVALHDEAGELLYLLARATALSAQAAYNPAVRDAQLRDARQLNLLAEASFGPDRTPRAVWQQRADLARALGKTQEADELAAKAQQVPATSPRDRYLIAHQHTIRGELQEALDLLDGVTHDDPRFFSAWFVRGNCHYELLQDAAAVASFNVCVTLRPDFHACWYNRGLAHLRLRQFQSARKDFDQALRLKPDLSDGYIARALAREGMQAYPDAIADYTKALDCPSVSTRVWFLRSAALRKTGDADGAQRDYDRGLATEPSDEASWIARGSARRDRDPKGALADYEQALKLNPRSFDALQNKADLLSDKFGDDAAALAVLDSAAALFPQSVLARGGRGVLLARAGQRARAIADAQACLLLDSGPPTQYRVACIYALTSKEAPADRLQALPLLSASLRAGFGLEFVADDTDLDPLRPLPEFQGLVSAARTLHAPR